MKVVIYQLLLIYIEFKLGLLLKLMFKIIKYKKYLAYMNILFQRSINKIFCYITKINIKTLIFSNILRSQNLILGKKIIEPFKDFLKKKHTYILIWSQSCLNNFIIKNWDSKVTFLTFLKKKLMFRTFKGWKGLIKSSFGFLTQIKLFHLKIGGFLLCRYF